MANSHPSRFNFVEPDETVLNALGAYAAHRGVSRAAACRMLLREGLRRAEVLA